MHFDLLNIALAVLLLGGLVAIFTRPANAIYAYLIVLFFFPNVSWGVAAGVEAMNLYHRGTGYFYFSIVNLYLYGLVVLGIYLWGRHNPAVDACNIRKYFLFLLMLFMVQVLIGTMENVPITKILSVRGTINTVNLGLFTMVLIRAINSPREVQRLASLILMCATVRGIFGMGRYLFFGGDIANVYDNVQKLGIKLTFFDINDGLVACLAAFIAAWRLFDKAVSASRKPLYLALVLLEIAIVALSYRRTGWGGLALAAVLFCFMQPVRLRIALLAGGVGLGGLGLTALIARRFAKLSHGKDVGGMLFYDIKGVKDGRFAELYQAFQTVAEHPVFGVGPWGGYGPGPVQREFMHSGFLHMWLKSGLVGLLPFILMFLAFAWFGWSRRRDVPWSHRDTFGAGMAGILFMVPTLFTGTPIIEYRTMQIMALCMALPYLTYGVFRGAATTAQVQRLPSAFEVARQKLIDAERGHGTGLATRPL
ncbi:MAG: O-antigen ligase family protein [Gammaproteobacteria bacterium]|nr:O-antigen ligase family protein [Gammaproteobacteria bacterium]